MPSALVAEMRKTIAERAIGILTPRRLAERFRGITHEQQKLVAEVLGRAQTELRAGAALAPLGHSEGALVLVHRARDATREAIALLETTELTEAARAAIADAKRELEIDDTDREDYAVTRAAVARAHRALEGIAWTPRDVRRLTWERRFAAIATVLAVVVMALLARRVLRAPRVTASAHFSGTFLPEMAIDGDVETDWLLTDRSPGYLDVHIRPARYVKRIWIVNARNMPHNDRGTQNYTVEVYRGSDTLLTQPGSFSTPGVNEYREIPIGQTTDLIRINIQTYFANGGGLAEVKID